MSNERAHPRILITGGAGYIGSVLVGDCLRAGFHVTVVDSFQHQVESLVNLSSVDGINIVRGDVRDRELMGPLLKATHVFIPLAGIVGAPACDQAPDVALAVNRDSILWACEQLSEEQRVIFPSTSSVYGKSDPAKACDEASPVSPVSIYAKGKWEAETEVMKRKNSISLRLAGAFGLSPRMRLDLLINDFVFRAVHERVIVLFESHFKRNFIHVRDASAAFLHAMRNFEVMKGQIYNCGLPEANVSKLELCDMVREQLPDLVVVEATLGKDPDQRNYLVSHDKLLATGFSPAYKLRNGIKELITAFLPAPSA